MTTPIRARLGELYQQQLDEAGVNTSAALRAFVLLGMAAAGVDMRPFRREIARTLAEDLSAGVLAALERLDLDRPSPAPPALPLPQVDDPGARDGEEDPFLSVGLDV
jgi:hypothetical protein